MQQIPQPRKDPAIASILELFPGFLGLPGLGWVYADQLGTGLLVIVIHWAVLIGGVLLYVIGVPILGIATAGAGFLLYCCVPAVPLLALIVPVSSAVKVNAYLNEVNYLTTAASPAQIVPRKLTAEKDMRSWVTSTPPQQIIQKSGMTTSQVVIIIILTVVATAIFLCGGLALLGALVGPPPG